MLGSLVPRGASGGFAEVWGTRGAVGTPREERRKGNEAAATDGANERVDFFNYRITPVIPAFKGLGK